MHVAKKPPARTRGKARKRRYTDIVFEVKDQVAWITINRPRVMNAFREQSLDEMIEAREPLGKIVLDPTK